jgi:hypothetical protein
MQGLSSRSPALHGRAKFQFGSAVCPLKGIQSPTRAVRANLGDRKKHHSNAVLPRCTSSPVRALGVAVIPSISRLVMRNVELECARAEGYGSGRAKERIGIGIASPAPAGAKIDGRGSGVARSAGKDVA